jgi:hypothetical protein
VLLHLITGRPGSVRDARKAGEHLGEVIARAMAADPAARYLDADAFLGALEAAAEQRFGAGWLLQAGASSIVAATGTAAVLAAGSPAGAGAATAAGTGHLAEQGRAPYRSVREHPGRTGIGASRKVVAGTGIGAAAVTTAVVLLAGGDDRRDYPRGFTGSYRVTSVVTAAQSSGTINQAVPHRVGDRTTQYWTVHARCAAKKCTATGTVDSSTSTASSLSKDLSFVLKGTRWVATGGEDHRCSDADQNPVPGTSYTDRFSISVEAPSSGRPKRLTGSGSYDSASTTPPACEGMLRLSFDYTLTRVSASDVPPSTAPSSSARPTPNLAPAPAGDVALADKALILTGDLPRTWTQSDPAPDVSECDYTAGSATLLLGRGARKDGARFRFDTTQRYLSSTSYVFATKADSDAFVRQFRSAVYLKCVKRVKIAALPNPPIGATFYDGPPIKPQQDAQGNGFLAYRYLVLYEIKNRKYVPAGTIELSLLHRLGRVITVTTIESPNTQAAFVAAQQARNAADDRIFARVWPIVSRER